MYAYTQLTYQCTKFLLPTITNISNPPHRMTTSPTPSPELCLSHSENYDKPGTHPTVPPPKLQSLPAIYCIVRYCTVLYSTVLYCTVLYCTVRYGTVLYGTVRYCTIMYYTILYLLVRIHGLGQPLEERIQYSVLPRAAAPTHSVYCFPAPSVPDLYVQ